MYLLILGGMAWGISALIRSMKQRRAERIRQAQIARINAENARRKAEIARVKEGIHTPLLEQGTVTPVKQLISLPYPNAKV